MRRGQRAWGRRRRLKEGKRRQRQRKRKKGQGNQKAITRTRTRRRRRKGRSPGFRRRLRRRSGNWHRIWESISRGFGEVSAEDGSCWQMCALTSRNFSPERWLLQGSLARPQPPNLRSTVIFQN